MIIAEMYDTNIIRAFAQQDMENLILVTSTKRLSKVIKAGYNLDVIKQSACLVLNPVRVLSFGFLFNCTTMGQASD